MIRNPHEHCRREYNPKSMHLLPRSAPLMCVIPAKAGSHCYGRPRRLNREAINRIRYVGWRAARVLIQRDVLLPEACCLKPVADPRVEGRDFCPGPLRYLCGV